MDRPIYAASVSCHGNLRHCVDRYAPFDDDWASQRLIDFNIWSAASGALDDGRYSLDNKLILTKTTVTVVSDLLDLLSIFVNACVPSLESPTGPGLLESASPGVEHDGARIRPDTPISAISPGGVAIERGHQQAWSLFNAKGKRLKRELSPEEREAREAAEDTFSSVVQVTAVARRSLAHSNLWLADFTFPEDDEDLGGYRQKPLGQMKSPLKGERIKSRATDSFTLANLVLAAPRYVRTAYVAKDPDSWNPNGQEDPKSSIRTLLISRTTA
ncbi:uncharacterized protein ColSpa_11417 [Colletotrichum spaethianum]|uniref:Uncharacterized protein n=1 Tax=Colletotrichum spaethianum TaxID=700344 RepID=A0AA37PFA7_9PEZI|nr:uncharacterized protein ColSpa_11417 [Colletotrichum spaethianum]GKT51236.1 hypothetical protein ColSpa_11417 [Colletotrichum spaethianum]